VCFKSLLRDHRALTDGSNYMTAYPPTSDKEWPVAFEVCGANNPFAIISAIEKAVGCCLISEHDDNFDDIRTRGVQGKL
jgi:hypothetical protein